MFRGQLFFGIALITFLQLTPASPLPQSSPTYTPPAPSPTDPSTAATTAFPTSTLLPIFAVLAFLITALVTYLIVRSFLQSKRQPTSPTPYPRDEKAHSAFTGRVLGRPRAASDAPSMMSEASFAGERQFVLVNGVAGRGRAGSDAPSVMSEDSLQRGGRVAFGRQARALSGPPSIMTLDGTHVDGSDAKLMGLHAAGSSVGKETFRSQGVIGKNLPTEMGGSELPTGSGFLQ
ncbi:hypothetical protein HK097_009540 [Rhizophlyctis rosea]|uniref:Uncharacterized protein n=1 Tax=Rhizophlyctis rosea TaxID=64517 RepID=A0AAD5SJ27_9FUNG|nr:hypothetical protein HK097_009540 [Rhizophlyctis rosea]